MLFHILLITWRSPQTFENKLKNLNCLFLSGQTGSIFPVQDGQYKQEDARGHFHSFIICFNKYIHSTFIFILSVFYTTQCTLTIQNSYWFCLCIWVGKQTRTYMKLTLFYSLSVCHCCSVRWLVSVMVACPVWGACWTEGWVRAEPRVGPIRSTAYLQQPMACWLRSTKAQKQVRFDVMLNFSP